MSNNTYVQRRVTLARLLLKVEAGACSLEHALGEAWNGGYLEGSELDQLTKLDTSVLDVIANTETATVEALRHVHPKLADAISDARVAEMNFSIEGAF